MRTTMRAGKTTLTVKQDNNANQEDADTMAANNWCPVLEGIEEIAER